MSVDERKVISNINIEGAQLIFRNFEGKPTQYNQLGNRNFGVILPDDIVDKLESDGWNVKWLKPKDDGDEPKPWLPVKVKFNPIPPIVQLITESGRIPLNEDTVGQLDWIEMVTCDVVIRPYNYPAMNGRPSGVSAYLKAIYVVPEENDFDRKYGSIPFVNGGDK